MGLMESVKREVGGNSKVSGSEIRLMESLNADLHTFETWGRPIVDDYGDSRTNIEAFGNCKINVWRFGAKMVKIVRETQK